MSGPPDSVFANKEIPWRERKQMIFQRYPRIAEMEVGAEFFERIFAEDPTIMGSLINDILRAETKQDRPGKRPAMDEDVAAERWRRLAGEDFTDRPFPEAFEALKGERSLRHTARMVSIDKMTISAMLKGTREPTIEDLELIATGLGKHPSFFKEWREVYVLSFLAAIFEKHPEMLMVQFKKLRGLAHGGS